MNYFNPFLNQNNFQKTPKFDPVKFKQAASQLDKETLSRLVQQARAQGIPDNQIEEGLNYILNNK